MWRGPLVVRGPGSLSRISLEDNGWPDFLYYSGHIFLLCNRLYSICEAFVHLSIYFHTQDMIMGDIRRFWNKNDDWNFTLGEDGGKIILGAINLNWSCNAKFFILFRSEPLQRWSSPFHRVKRYTGALLSRVVFTYNSPFARQCCCLLICSYSRIQPHRSSDRHKMTPWLEP